MDIPGESFQLGLQIGCDHSHYGVEFPPPIRPIEPSDPNTQGVFRFVNPNEKPLANLNAVALQGVAEFYSLVIEMVQHERDADRIACRSYGCAWPENRAAEITEIWPRCAAPNRRSCREDVPGALPRQTSEQTACLPVQP
jgi:hypothetical protein